MAPGYFVNARVLHQCQDLLLFTCLVSSHHLPPTSPSSFVPLLKTSLSIHHLQAENKSHCYVSPASIQSSLPLIRPKPCLSSCSSLASFYSQAKAFVGLIIFLKGWSFFFSSNSLSKGAEILFCKYRFLSDNTQTLQAGIQSPAEFYHFHPFLSYMCIWEVPVTNARIFHTSYPPQSNFSALTQTIQTPWDACVLHHLHTNALHLLSPISYPFFKLFASSLVVTGLSLPLSSEYSLYSLSIGVSNIAARITSLK